MRTSLVGCVVLAASILWSAQQTQASVTAPMADGSITTPAGTYGQAYKFLDSGAVPGNPDRWNIVASDLTFEGQVKISDINQKARWNTWDGGGGTNLGAWFMLGPYAGSGKGVWWTGVQWTGGGDSATDIRHIFHMQDRQGTQPDPKYYTQPYTKSGGGWLNDWFDFQLVVHATSNTTGTAQLWIHDELVNGQGQTSPPPIDTFAFDITGAAKDLTDMRLIMWMINGDNPSNPDYTLAWQNVSITGSPTIPEPASIIVWSLLGLAAAGYGLWRRKRTA